MKETRSYSLGLYELMTNLIDVDKINNKVLKFLVSMLMLPVLFLFIFIELGIEEPLKCIFAVILMKSSVKGAWNHYKKCWTSLLFGMRNQ